MFPKHDPNHTTCEKHNFRGYDCPFCDTERYIAIGVNQEKERIKPLMGLLSNMAMHGGKLVCTNQLSQLEVATAQSEGRMFVNEDFIGYAWVPSDEFYKKQPPNFETN